MGETFDPDDLSSRANRYAKLSKGDLLIELDNLIQPVSYAVAPSPEEKKREGQRIWLRLRPKLARLVCKERPKGGNQSMGVLITAGGGTFISEVAKMILGSGMLPDITAAVAAAAAGLLFKEVQSGLDDFCEAYYVPEET
jgi:hypothetical protein